MHESNMHDASHPTPDAGGAGDAWRAGPPHDAFGGDERYVDSTVARDPAVGRRPIRRWVVGAVTAIAVAAGGVIGVTTLASHTRSAASPTAGGGGPGGAGGRGATGSPFGNRSGDGTTLSGTITSVDGTSLVVRTTSGTTTTVATTSATDVARVVKSSPTSIKVGDHVTVVGSGGTTTLAATTIIDSGSKTTQAGSTSPGGSPPARGSGPGASASAPGGTPPGGPGAGDAPVAGTVESIDGSTFVVTTSSGHHVTVTTTSTTSVVLVESATVSQLAAGEQVTLSGSMSGSTFTATAIQEGTGLGSGRPGGSGSA